MNSVSLCSCEEYEGNKTSICSEFFQEYVLLMLLLNLIHGLFSELAGSLVLASEEKTGHQVSSFSSCVRLFRYMSSDLTEAALLCRAYCKNFCGRKEGKSYFSSLPPQDI